jgi:hypothetical protein
MTAFFPTTASAPDGPEISKSAKAPVSTTRSLPFVVLAAATPSVAEQNGIAADPAPATVSEQLSDEFCTYTVSASVAQ